VDFDFWSRLWFLEEQRQRVVLMNGSFRQPFAVAAELAEVHNVEAILFDAVDDYFLRFIKVCATFFSSQHALMTAHVEAPNADVKEAFLGELRSITHGTAKRQKDTTKMKDSCLSRNGYG
jgi:hypothetical protein